MTKACCYCVLIFSAAAWGQAAGPGLPDAPSPVRIAFLPGGEGTQTTQMPDGSPRSAAPAAQGSGPAGSANPQLPSNPAGVPGAQLLSIKDAEQLAIKDNPQISVARLAALASQQRVREQKSNLWPTAVADLTAVDSQDNSRITAGGLNNPVIYRRAAVGASVTQLITDFGRTNNLISSASLAAKAESENAVATEEQIRLATDQAFYDALRAHSVTQVAQQTVNARQTVADQIQALFNSKLKSQLDLSFANVNLSQAKLLLLDAQNNENASLAALSAVLGLETLNKFQLVEDTTALNSPTANIDDLIAQAFRQRPELLALDFEYQSARKFQSAERDLLLPAIRAAGAVGDTPVRDPVISNWYGAVGVNVSIPIFNGFLYTARAKEASLRTQAANERTREMRDRVARDVRTTWLNASTAYSRLSVSQELVNQANQALDLAQTRYKLGLSSIVELSQAQLQQTQAEIGNTDAMYEYRLAQAALRYEVGGP